ncbi:hypothetical protein PCH70_15320 [Pseudomonas cichorii JBC1]|nr:hypothetical protein PCH70_15320 [Pseudomonas cichorii JBC1]
MSGTLIQKLSAPTQGFRALLAGYRQFLTKLFSKFYACRTGGMSGRHGHS